MGPAFIPAAQRWNVPIMFSASLIQCVFLLSSGCRMRHWKSVGTYPFDTQTWHPFDLAISPPKVKNQRLALAILPSQTAENLNTRFIIGTFAERSFFLAWSSKSLSTAIVEVSRSMTDKNVTASSWVETIAGFTAGVVSTVCLHPLDLIKTRLQGTE